MQQQQQPPVLPSIATNQGCIITPPPRDWHLVPTPDHKRLNDVFRHWLTTHALEPYDVQIELLSDGAIYRVDIFVAAEQRIYENDLRDVRTSCEHIIALPQCNKFNGNSIRHRLGAVEIFVASAQHEMQLRATTTQGLLNAQDMLQKSFSSSSSSSSAQTCTENTMQRRHDDLRGVLEAARAACPQ